MRGYLAGAAYWDFSKSASSISRSAHVCPEARYRAMPKVCFLTREQRMTWLGNFGRTLVIAPHPDDEILGVGGTIARLTKAGHEVFVAVVTTGRPPDYSAAETARVRAEAARAHAHLGAEDIFWLNLPAARLAETSHVVQNEALTKIVRQVEPATLFVPFAGDIHMDHQMTFLSAMVAADRIRRRTPERSSHTKHCRRPTGTHPIWRRRSSPMSSSISRIHWR